MNNLIELLLEGIAKDQLDWLIGELSSESTVKSVTASEEPTLDLSSWEGQVLKTLERGGAKL